MSTAADESSPSPVRPFSPKATVNIVTWLLLVVSTVAVLVRVTIKRVTAKRLHIDDVLAILSVVTHVGSGAATTIASNNAAFNGVTLSDYQRRRFAQVSEPLLKSDSITYKSKHAQSLFASNFLFIATVCFAKTSILTLFNIITESKCITIITSCIPYMRPLLDALPSGMLMSDEMRRKDRVAGPKDSTYVRMADYGYVLKSTTSGREAGASRSAANSTTSNAQ
ncbi:hypothetical protein N0V90_012519 [Kalmusia sp. IMI 367209]|nr:hypothetical protein N0V90_012519 [Kalmusia sp. IMI 367209]